MPDEVSSHAGGIDVVVAGSETPWVTPTRVAAWRRLGIQVVGLHPRLDRPGAERLNAGGADLVLADDLDTDVIIREIRLLESSETAPQERAGTVTTVTAVSGGAGATEVAAALAWNLAGRESTVLLDGDLATPSLAVRFGLPPRPDLADLFDTGLGTGRVPLDEVPSIGRLAIVPGALRRTETGLRPDAVVDLSGALAFDRAVVVDGGTWPGPRDILRESDDAVVVVPATAIGIVRLARLAESWSGPKPDVILNRVPNARQDEYLSAARRWSGLEPMATVPQSRRIAAAAATGTGPHRLIRRRMSLHRTGGNE